MKRLLFALAAAVVAVLACRSLSAEPRIRVYADVDRPAVLAGREETIIIKVGLSGVADGCSARRPPLNVALVLDKSGSMGSEAKMANAKRGAIEVVERLSYDDVLALVVYDTGPRVVFPAQPVHDKSRLIDIISSIRPDGRTALYDGVSLGAAEVRRHLSWEFENRIILLSDGLANVGPSSTGDLAYLGRDLGNEGITVTTIGVGTDYNEDLMTALADRSGGNSYFASSSSELPRIFAEEIGEAMAVAAREVRIRIMCTGGARPISIVGREGEISGQSMTVTIGKIYGKNDKYALFEVQAPAGPTGRSLDVAEVSVEYVDPYTNETIADSRRVSLAYQQDERLVEEKTNREIVKEFALTRNSEFKREAVALADRGDVAGAAALVKKGAFELEKAAERCDKDKEMLGEAKICEAISADITANSGLTKYQRKCVVNQAYTQTTQQTYVPQEKKP
jgi:Ca-activated chloride channel family protein